MVLAVSLRERRRALLARPGLRGADFCIAFAEEADAWLAHIADGAAGGRTDHLALVAVGGYGRRELCPYSDLDLVLVHDGRRRVAALADAIWYPVWDDGVTLDHSVRRPGEVLSAAAQDVRVALGLLDGRVVWGQETLAAPLIDAARAQWRGSLGGAWLTTLVEQTSARWARHGDVAFLLEPDLKEARGGLRDARMLHAITSAAPELSDAVDLEQVDAAAQVLLAARVELHRRAGRVLDRLVLQEQDQVAAALGCADANELMAEVAASGRTIAWACSDTLSRRHRLEGAPPGRRPRPVARRSRRRRWSAEDRGRASPAHGTPTLVEQGVVLLAGEVDLDPATPPVDDPSLPFRLAAVSAERGSPIRLGALRRAAERLPIMPDPWTHDVRDALVRVLATGPAGVEALEALDHAGLLERAIGEWALVRNRPQRNAYHRYTVDRHLLEAAAAGAAIAARVARSDLLLVGCLLHDIGKGMPGDHTEAGVTLVERIGRRMGFSEDDVAVLVGLCRHHLLLADVATRRDLEDPATVEMVARAVGSSERLHLLAALTEADSRATGPAAWGPWKATLVSELVERVDRLLGGRPAPLPAPHPAARHASLVDRVRTGGRPAVWLDPPILVVVALDRLGLLSSVAGVLALHGLDVRRADASSTAGIAVEEFVIATDRDRWPEAASFLRDLDAVLAGRLELEARLAARVADYAGTRRLHASGPVRCRVSMDVDASVASTVIDVQAADEVGLLHRLSGVLSSCDLDVVSARVSTVGDTVVDAFYVRDRTGRKVTDPCVLRRIERSIVTALEDA